MDEMVRNKKIEISTKYRVLVNFLKNLIEEKEGYITIVNREDIVKILKALEEVE